MSTSEAEYKALSNLSKADKNFRVVQYLIAFFFLIVAIFLAFEIHATNQRVIGEVQAALKDIKISNDETRQYTTCLLLVPIGERTLEKQQACFDEIDKPGGIDKNIFQTSPPTNGVNATEPTVAPNQSQNSSSNDTLPANEAQRDTSQEPQPPVSPQPEPVSPRQPILSIPLIDSLLKALGGNNEL